MLAKGDGLILFIFIHLFILSVALPCLLCENGSSNKDNSGVKADGLRFLDFKSADVEDKDHGFVNSLQFEVASSPKGEVKLSLVCNSPQQSSFSVPKFNEVVKVVEDECRKSYRITEPSFSLMKLMKELCECYLEMTHVPANDDAKRIDSKSDCQQHFSIPQTFLNGSFKIQNLIEVMPQIPKHIALSEMDGFHCIIGFKNKNIESIYGRTDKKLNVSEEP